MKKLLMAVILCVFMIFALGISAFAIEDEIVETEVSLQSEQESLEDNSEVEKEEIPESETVKEENNSEQQNPLNQDEDEESEEEIEKIQEDKDITEDEYDKLGELKEEAEEEPEDKKEEIKEETSDNPDETNKDDFQQKKDIISEESEGDDKEPFDIEDSPEKKPEDQLKEENNDDGEPELGDTKSKENSSNGQYLLKFTRTTDEGEKTCQFFGGSEEGISVKDILSEFGIVVTSDTQIDVIDDSVDTAVIGVRRDGNDIYITDNGKFDTASKDLVITVDGQEVILSVTDDGVFYISSSGNDLYNNEGSKDNPFRTVEKAIEFTSERGKSTIYLLSDIVEEKKIVIHNKDIIFYLNGHEISCKENTVFELTGYKRDVHVEIHDGIIKQNSSSSADDVVLDLYQGSLKLYDVDVCGKMYVNSYQNDFHLEISGGRIAMPKEEIKSDWIASGCKAVYYWNPYYPQYETIIVSDKICVRSSQGNYYESISNAVTSGATYLTLVDDIKKCETIKSQERIMLDLAGYTFSYPSAVAIEVCGDVVIYDTSDNKTGKIEGNILCSSGTLIIASGSYNGTFSKSNNGNIFISGGKFSSNPEKYLKLTYKVENISEDPFYYQVVGYQWDYYINEDNSTVTAICRDSDALGRKSVTISAENVTYDGNPHACTISGDYDLEPFEDNFIIEYMDHDRKVILQEIPTDVGRYRATLTLLDNAKISIFIDYIISQVEIPNNRSINADYKISTSNPDHTSCINIVGSAMKVVFKDKNGQIIDPTSINIKDPALLLQHGVKTAEIRLTNSLTLILDIEKAMRGKSKCVISIEIIDGLISATCDNASIFEANVKEIIDTISKIVFDGHTVKAYDADGKVIKEFSIL